MRFFSTLTAFGLAALIAAQNQTSSDSTSTVVTSLPTLTANQECLKKCDSADICCQSLCVGVPCPSQYQANATTECAAKCPQGNGTQSETEQYASCQASCVSSYFLSTGTAGPSATASSGSATATFGGSDTTTAGGSAASASGGSSATGASASASATASPDNGAYGLHVGKFGLGLWGLVIVGLAL